MRTRFALALPALLLVPSARAGDFNGDGFDDLVIGALEFQPSGQPGALQFLYGSAMGLRSAGNMQVTALAGTDSLLANSVAVADFNADGFDDAAVHCSSATADGVPSAGQVAVFYGSASGLNPSNVQLLHQGVPGVKDKPEESDFGPEDFGHALAAGDFDGDGFADLAAAVHEGLGGKEWAGAVHVFYGGEEGLSTDGDQVWHQNKSGVKEKCEQQDDFGTALAAGDFDGNGRDDLAIGIGREAAKGAVDGPFGAVAILFGAKKGLRSGGDLLLSRADLGFTAVRPYALFGHSLAAGDFDGDGRDELAVGAQTEEFTPGVPAGGVYVLAGLEPGAGDVAAQLVRWVDLYDPNVEQVGMLFGRALVAADFDGNGADDLAIGAPNLDLGAGFDAGAIGIARGGPNGLFSAESQLFRQGIDGVPGTLETGDVFGRALAAGDFDGDGRADLAIGAPGDHFNAPTHGAGSVTVLRGTAAGTTATGSQVWFQGTDNLPGTPASGDSFGTALGS